MSRKSELDQLVLEYKAGNEDAINQIAPLIEYMIWSIVNKYTNIDNKEDLFQIGWVGVMKAIKKYEPDQGCSFSTYAYRPIVNEILMYYRSVKRHRTQTDEEGNPTRTILSLNTTPQQQHDEQRSEYIDMMIDYDSEIDSHIMKEEEIRILHESVEKLPDTDKFIINSLLAGHNQLYIADKLNISQPYSSTLTNRAKQRLAKIISREYKYLNFKKSS